MGGLTVPRDSGGRLAGAFVLCVLGLATLAFWIGIPVGMLWALGELTVTGPTHVVAGVLGVPLAMVAFAPVLFWLNGLYLRVTGVLARLAADEDETGWQRRVRGPLEPMLMASFLIALTALLVWFFVFAENPSPQVI